MACVASGPRNMYKPRDATNHWQNQAQRRPGQQPPSTRAVGGGAGDGSSLQHQKVINRQITRSAETGDLDRLLFTIQEHLSQMNGINLATSFHRVAKIASAGGPTSVASAKEQPIFQQLWEHVLQHVLNHSLRDESRTPRPGAVEEMPVHSFSIVAWCCATLQIRHKQLFAAVAEIATPRLGEFKSYEFSNLLWSFAKLSLGPCEMLRSMTARLLRRDEGEFKVQCLSTVAWSFTTIKRRNLVIFNSLARELTRRVHEMKPQEISNTLWAFAKSGCPDAELFEALGSAAITELGVFKPQEVSNTVWAFATVNLQHPRLFEGVAAAVMRRRNELVPQNLANILWAYARLGVRCPDMFGKLLQAAAQKLARHKPQELSAVIWAASQVCPENRAFFTAASRCCAERSQDFSLNGLANLVKALAVVENDAPEAVLQLVQSCTPKLHQFKVLALCSLLRGISCALQRNRCGSLSAEMVKSGTQVVEHLGCRVSECQPGELEELGAALRECPPSLPAAAGVAQAVASKEASSSQPARKPPQSVGSASTSADGSQAEEDWPTDDASSVEGADESERCQAASGAGAESLPLPPGLEPSSCRHVAADTSAGSQWTPLSTPHILDLSCLAIKLPGGSMQALQPYQVDVANVLGRGSDEVLLRCGMLDTRVVLKRLPFQAPLMATMPPHPNVLQPVANVYAPQCFGAPFFAAYPRCEQGSLLDWMSAQYLRGQPPSASQAACIALGVLQGAESLFATWGSTAVKVVQPDEIFISFAEVPKVREPCPSTRVVDSEMFKWISPEEASGALLSGSGAWEALAFRLGTLLYCLGTEHADPHPGVSGEVILQGLLMEVGGGPPVRPDLSAYRGPDSLRRLVACCLRIGGLRPPPRAALVEALAGAASEAFSSSACLSANSEEPMKVAVSA